MPHKVPTHRPTRLSSLSSAKSDSPARQPSPFYSLRAWRGSDGKVGVRQLKLNQDPLCEDCKVLGRIELATQVHHMIEVKDSQEDALDLVNLRSLCSACHSRITGCRR
jgi:5-methylcytosine-specific restriction enzyme A